jgi:hypothetical protein
MDPIELRLVGLKRKIDTLLTTVRATGHAQHRASKACPSTYLFHPTHKDRTNMYVYLLHELDDPDRADLEQAERGNAVLVDCRKLAPAGFRSLIRMLSSKRNEVQRKHDTATDPVMIEYYDNRMQWLQYYLGRMRAIVSGRD